MSNIILEDVNVVLTQADIERKEKRKEKRRQRKKAKKQAAREAAVELLKQIQDAKAAILANTDNIIEEICLNVDGHNVGKNVDSEFEEIPIGVADIGVADIGVADIGVEDIGLVDTLPVEQDEIGEQLDVIEAPHVVFEEAPHVVFEEEKIFDQIEDYNEDAGLNNLVASVKFHVDQESPLEMVKDENSLEMVEQSQIEQSQIEESQIEQSQGEQLYSCEKCAKYGVKTVYLEKVSLTAHTNSQHHGKNGRRWISKQLNKQKKM